MGNKVKFFDRITLLDSRPSERCNPGNKEGKLAGEITLDIDELRVDAVYEGLQLPNGMYADPLNRLANVANQGGFRYRGTKDHPTLIVLTSNFSEPDWPDELDNATGRFVYYGDNRAPGRDIHKTAKSGNHLLRVLFDHLHLGRRHLCPPVLAFAALRAKRSFAFRGLAVPGFPGVPPTQDLVSVWKSVNGQRFQNYRATLTILNEPTIDKGWIDEALKGLPSLENAPPSWRNWVQTGEYKPLKAPAARAIRTREEQLTQDRTEQQIIDCILNRFEGRATCFEACAAELAKLLLGDVTTLELTRPWRDGGRDAVGEVRLGRDRASIEVKFALEAKCYAKKAVGVAEVSRLISRIRYREFGILVTTSYLATQAYKEILEDGHPIVIVCARDIVTLLREKGYATLEEVMRWLDCLDPEKAEKS